MAMKIVKWASIPVLLVASLFACCAANYEVLVDLIICVGAIMLIRQAVRLQEYFWVCGYASIVVAFTPLPLAVKALFLMGFANIGALAMLWTAFRTLPVEDV